MRALVLALGLLLSLPLTAAGLYRDTGPDGERRYDDLRRERTERIEREQLEKRRIPPAPIRPDSPEGRALAERQRRCAHWQAREQALLAAPVHYERDPFGNSVRLSATQVRILLAQTERSRREACSPG